ncbi:hypothetical protein [Paraburkholderia sp. D1E]|uniref:hypothetical protein n=1 Tax=Paraburkholderia sp. D1E TaxID=3461398 RepID=UPI0040462D8C
MAASISLDEYFSVYIRELAAALDYCASPNLLKASISAKALAANPDILRFSLIFNELTQVVLPTAGTLQLIVPQGKAAKETFGKSGLALNMEIAHMKELGLTPDNLPDFSPAFVLPEGKESEGLLRELSAIINQGRLVVAPERAAMYVEKVAPDGSREWKLLNIQSDSPLAAWTIDSERKNETIPIVSQGIDNPAHKDLFDITVPYFANLSYTKLASILADEADLVASLRVAIKSAVKDAKEPNVAREVIQDVVNPKLDMMERKFKGLLSRYAVSLAGASVTTVGLAYTAITSQASIPAAIAGLAGAGGLALLSKEYSAWKEKQAALKDDPLYFLWRCKKEQR